MAGFTRFNDFPPEIRLMIWRHALENEASSRIILVHRASLRIMPSKSLISPLLLANHESRSCAKEFYNVQVDIYATPPIVPDMDEFKAFYDARTFRRSAKRPLYRYKAPYWYECGQYTAYSAAEQMLRRGPDPTTGKLQGSVFLSTDRDRFAMSCGYSKAHRTRGLMEPPAPYGAEFDICAAHFTLDAQREFLAPSTAGQWNLGYRQGQWRHASAPLSGEVCHRVRNVIATFETYSRRRAGYWRSCEERIHAGYRTSYEEEHAIRYWRSDAFDAIEKYLHLRLADSWTFVDELFAGDMEGLDIRELDEQTDTNVWELLRYENM